LRLARFNTNHDSIDKRFFQGLPSPAAAALVAGFIWVMHDYGFVGADVRWIAVALTLFAGLSMVSYVYAFTALKISICVKAFHFIAIFLLALIFYPDFQLSARRAVFLLFFGYALSGYVSWLYGLRKNPTVPPLTLTSLTLFIRINQAEGLSCCLPIPTRQAWFAIRTPEFPAFRRNRLDSSAHCYFYS
jgi:CDP-diacylglycerol--serine O-phosphatidyltransferase